MKCKLCCAAALLTATFVVAPASAAQFPADAPINATLLKSWDIQTGELIYSNASSSNGPEAVTANAVYSNVTTFTGSGITNGGAAVDPAAATNTITTLIADDITATAASSVVLYRFNVANFNTTAVSARPRTRFYADNAGVPGNFLGGNTFNPISFGAASVGTYSATIAALAFPQKFWAGITFDNNGGGTGATAT